MYEQTSDANAEPDMKPGSRWLILFCLVFAGEIIFSLPFHITRFFRYTFLEVFGFSNAELGDIFAVYGILALLAYFPGGAIADHFSARKLMSLSLLATAIGGFFMAQVPGFWAMAVLYGYWGLTSILLFWAALIKTTREWGGEFKQGSAFGILDGGRGLIAAITASIAVWLLSLLLPSDLETLTASEREYALQSVIYFYSLMTLSAALLVWMIIPHRDNNAEARIPVWQGMSAVIKKPVVWLQAIIIICAYSAYKALDNYGLYAQVAFNMSELEAAEFVTNGAYLRPVAAIITGFIVDRFVASRVIAVFFAVLAASYALLGFAPVSGFAVHYLYANIIVTFVTVFGIRGVYFALIEETKINRKVTGTAVGLISVIGFTPEVFFASIAGRLLDAAPGTAGHQHVFLMLAGFAVLGILATVLLARIKPR
jgi:nitrate/nitrite transporter NarK